MYSIADFGRMIANRERLQPYLDAMRQAVRPGMTVADIGAGAGIFSLVACQLGASKVYAIEPNRAIDAAKAAAAALGCQDRIQCLQSLSTSINLPERVDVIVSDIRGALPFFQRSIPSLIDARRRFLAPGGAMIPRRDTVFAALCHAPVPYGKHVGVWTDNLSGIAMPEIARMASNCWHRARLAKSDLRSDPVECTAIDYLAEERTQFTWSIQLTASTSGIAHGLALWFDCEPAPGILYSNAPGEPELVYGQGFFPWTHPVVLEQGDMVDVQMAVWNGDDDFDWSWSTRVSRSGVKIANYKQGTWLNQVPHRTTLRRRAAGFVPSPSEDARVDGFVLGAMNGDASLQDIAHRVREQFPDRFSCWEDALSHVGALSAAYAA